MSSCFVQRLPAEYWSVCLPAFTPGRVNREGEARSSR